MRLNVKNENGSVSLNYVYKQHTLNFQLTDCNGQNVAFDIVEAEDINQFVQRFGRLVVDKEEVETNIQVSTADGVVNINFYSNPKISKNNTVDIMGVRVGLFEQFNYIQEFLKSIH